MHRSVLDRFPDRRRAIEELARTDDEFRLLCADLADAEIAADHWERQPTDVGKARGAEYRDLARDLAGEVEAMLDLHARTGSGRSPG